MRVFMPPKKNNLEKSQDQCNLINRIFALYKQSPRIAILMSGKGSNADTLLNEAYRYPNLQFISICTDQKTSQAHVLSKKYGVEYFCLEGDVTSQVLREDYFHQLGNYLRSMDIDTLIYAGFMKISPSFFVNEFPGINVHPADLTIKNEHGKPKYVGMHAIHDAIQQGETYLASTAHVVDTEVDCGAAILVSKHLSLEGRLVNDIPSVHEQLKVSCEHILFPTVLELMSKGLLSVDQVPYRFNALAKSIKPQAGHHFSSKLLAIKDKISPLDLAYLSQDYSSEVGFDFTAIDQVIAKVQEEFHELMEAFENREEQWEHFIDEIGDCFFSLVNLCRFIELHPEAVVKRNVLKYLRRCNYIENFLEKNEQNWTHITSETIKNLWREAKKNESK